MNTKKIMAFFYQACTGLVTLCLGISSAYAGGAFSTTPDGVPVLWQGTVTYRVETGPIKGDTPADGGGGGGGGGSSGGCQLTKNLDVPNSQGLDIVRNAFNAWKSVANSSIDIQEGPSLGVDVNFDNVEKFWVGSFFGGSVASEASAAGCYDSDPNTECLNSIIFDSSNVPERSLVDAIQGQCARFSILAFAAILPQQNNDAQGTITSPILKSAQAVISGACLAPVIAPDPNCGPPDAGGGCPTGGISIDELQGTVTHELGHFLGLDHTLVNKQNYIDCQKGSASCNLENIPTMIGLFVPGANLHSLHYDDATTFARFYPTSTVDGGGGVKVIPGTCTIKGVLKATSQANKPWRCEEVVARLNNDPGTSASIISGVESKRFSQGIPGDSSNNGKNQSNCNESDPNKCGYYEIRGLQPGTYTMSVHNFNDNGNNVGLSDFVLEPCTPALTSTVVSDNEALLNSVVCTAGVVTNADLNAP